MFRTLFALARPFLLIFVLGLALLSISRIGLGLWQAERVLAAGQWHLMILNGLRIDITTMVYVTLIPFMVLNLTALADRSHAWGHALARVWFFVCLTVLFYLELMTPNFISEYTLRPNQLFIDYLIYPREVLAMLWEGYKLEIFLILSLTLAFATGFWRFCGSTLKAFERQRWHAHLLILLIGLPVLALAARSTLGHRPINPAMVAFSADPLLNQLTLNSAYSVAFTLYSRSKSEKQATDLYGRMDEDEVVQRVTATMAHKPDSSLTASEGEVPTLHTLQPVYNGPRRNVVILLQESLGARFVGKLGGAPGLTPALDGLMGQGWAFSRFFATGTRSVRGIEAVTTGFVPGPAEAVVKLPGSQHDFFTIFSALKAQGYHTQFIYGGEAHFDNMKSFFFGNGVQQVVDLPQFAHRQFVGSWGASDEDLYNQAHDEFMRLHGQGQNFVSLVFTSTNHTPFEFPDGRIEITPGTEKQTRENAIRYSDWALGQFFSKAQASPYWANTVFMVVADHDARIYENDLMPIRSFHIPALILGGGIAPRHDQQLASSLDVVPTLLSQAGVQARIPAIGRDLARPQTVAQARAMMQFDQHFGYLTQDHLVVLQPQKPAVHYQVDWDRWQLAPGPDRPELARDALAHVLWSSLAYRKEAYRAPH